MEDVPKGEHVLADMFSLNGHPIIILFNSDATHNFISKACTKNYQLTTMHLSTPYVISTLGGKMFIHYLTKNTPLNLAEKVYKTGLIILDDQGIDVILGISWMKQFKALLNIAAHVVHLESPAHGSIVLQLPTPTVTSSTLHHVTTPCLKDIPVACEFPDVFPEDLSVIPSNQDIEFTLNCNLELHLSSNGHTR
jgi:hypothetical protein